MGFGLKRDDLQRIAQAKLDDAITLLEADRFSNAYYLAGYAIEIGLKACVARQIVADTIPDKEFLKRVLNHDFNTLIGLAGLRAEFTRKKDDDADFATNWALVSEWSPDIRYETQDKTSAQLMITAIIDENSGVFLWIKEHW